MAGRESEGTKRGLQVLLPLKVQIRRSGHHLGRGWLFRRIVEEGASRQGAFREFLLSNEGANPSERISKD